MSSLRMIAYPRVDLILDVTFLVGTLGRLVTLQKFIQEPPLPWCSVVLILFYLS